MIQTRVRETDKTHATRTYFICWKCARSLARALPRGEYDQAHAVSIKVTQTGCTEKSHFFLILRPEGELSFVSYCDHHLSCHSYSIFNNEVSL